MNTKSRLLQIMVFCCLFAETVYSQPSGGGWSKNVSLQAKGIPGRSGGSSDVWGWRDSQTGKDYVLVTINRNLSIVETTNPSSPVERAYVTATSGNLETPDVEVYESGGNAYAYLARDVLADSGFTALIINLRQAISTGGVIQIDPLGSNPFNNVFVGRIPGVNDKMERGHTLTIAGGILYICPSHATFSGPDAGKSYFDVWDLRSNPTSPSHLGLYQAVLSSTNAEHRGIHEIFAKSTGTNTARVYAAALTDGLQVFDLDYSGGVISTVSSTVQQYDYDRQYPTLIGSGDASFDRRITHSAFPTDDEQYIFTTDELLAPQIQASDDDSYPPKGDGNELTSNARKGAFMRVWKRSELATSTALKTGYDVPEGSAAGVTSLSSVAVSTVPNSVHQLFIRGNYAYIANYTQGFRVLDISQLGSNQITEIAYYDDFPTMPNQGDGDNVFYRSNWYNGVYGVFPDPNRPNIVYAGSFTAGLYVFSVCNFSGTLAVNTTLSGPITVSGNTTVPSGITLTIDPGATVAFASGTSLIANGQILANGTSPSRITLTKSGSSNWVGISLTGANGSSVSYTTISYATEPVKVTSMSSFTMSNDSIKNANFSDNGALQFYGSNPTISNVVILGQSGASNGVRFAGSGGVGSNGSITSSTIRDLGMGNGIVVQGNSSPIIRSNLIENNLYHGIVVDDNSSGVPLIIANTVRDNVQNYTNIHVKYYSTARLGSNSVRGGYFGYYWEDGSTSNTYWTGSYDYLAGQNSARANFHGIRADGYCNVWFGDYDLFHGEPIYYGACNNIDSSSQYKASSVDHSWILAEANWWGTYPPNQLYWDGTSSLSTGYALQSATCPSGGIEFAAGGDSSPSMNEESVSLRDAYAAMGRGEYLTAKEIFSEILQTFTNGGLRAQAAVGLLDVNRLGKDLSVIPLLESFANSEGEVGMVVSEVLLGIYSGLGRFSDAENIAREICRKYPGTKHEKNALYALASLKWFDESQKETSEKYLAQLLTKYGSSLDDATLAILGVSRSVSADKTAQATSIASGELAIGNFPNPFNPSTTISFVLPEDGHVTLKVYDLLGRVVQELVNETMTAGSHQTIFDASRLPSGVYFYKLDLSGGSISKKLILTK